MRARARRAAAESPTGRDARLGPQPAAASCDPPLMHPLPRICRPRHHPVRQVWALLAHYEGKLCTEYDCPRGWQRSLAPKVGA